MQRDLRRGFLTTVNAKMIDDHLFTQEKHSRPVWITHQTNILTVNAGINPRLNQPLACAWSKEDSHFS